MVELLENCPLCGSTEFESHIKCMDFTVSKETFNIVTCKHCHFLFTNPRPDRKNIEKYYISEQYNSHAEKKKGFLGFLYDLIRSFSTKRKFRIIRRYSHRKAYNTRLLDYGCGIGYFLKSCMKKGYICMGVEPNEKAKKIASQSIKNVYTDLDDTEANVSFDVITLWHVLEHIHELNTILSKLTEKLSKDGILLIAVPNPESYDAQVYKEYWAAYDVPRHLYHFTHDSLQNLMQQYGFKIIKRKALFFDSFYISLLSNQHQSGKSKIFLSLITGLYSNLKALFNQQYSSNIYILKKT